MDVINLGKKAMHMLGTDVSTYISMVLNMKND